MRRSDIEQAVGMGCGVLSIVITVAVSLRLHLVWSLDLAAIPFALAFVAFLVHIIGNAAIKPVAMFVVYISLGCYFAMALVDRRHEMIYGVGGCVGALLFGLLGAVALARDKRRSRR
jgi:hypothetical protein